MASIDERFNLVSTVCSALGPSQDDQIINGLTATPNKSIPYFMLYDAAGSDFFEQITALPEYYQTRTEKEIIDTSVDEITACDPPYTVLVELGSGSSFKTRPVIASLLRQLKNTPDKRSTFPSMGVAPPILYYVPIDISRSMLEESSKQLLAEIDDPLFRVTAVHGFYSDGMEAVRRMFPEQRKLVIWLGSSIGNMNQTDATNFIADIANTLSGDDRLLIGMDLMKDENVLHAAYDDSQKVTAAFIKNILVRLNSEYDANFNTHQFEHHVEINKELNRVEIYLKSTCEQKVHIHKLGIDVQFACGEKVHIENCHKYKLDEIPTLLSKAEVRHEQSWVDPKKLFSLNSFAPANKNVVMPNGGLLNDTDSRMLHHTLLAQLSESWSVSDKVFGILAADNEVLTAIRFLKRPIDLRHPFLFYVGHLAAFEHSHILQNFAKLRIKFNDIPGERYIKLFERGIDPDVDDPTKCHSHSADINHQQWPHLSEVQQYRDVVRRSVRAMLPELARSCNAKRLKQVVQLCTEHTLMHSETLIYMISQMNHEDLLPPISKRDVTAPPVEGLEDFVAIKGGKVRLGADYGTIDFGWDNEFGFKEVDVRDFQIGKYPITNGQFLKFIRSGDYNNPVFWKKDDWEWKLKCKVTHPASWKQDAMGNYMCRTIFGDVPIEDVSMWPAYISCAEANAYANSKGARLITEAEFHLVADELYDNIASSRCKGQVGNYNFNSWEPTPVNAYPAGMTSTGVWDLIGNGWEWTSDLFMPFPGFVAHIPQYPGYSSDFFDGKHHVLAGASWATSSRLIRKTFRNFYQVHYPYMFAKFRLAKDVSSA